jgi:hypothetical protein
MNQIKEEQSHEENSIEEFARFARGLFNVARVVQQELQIIAEKIAPYIEKAAPYLVALGKVDWPALKQRLDELPKKSKDAMRLALAEGWFFGWHDGLHSLMELVDTLQTQPSTIDDVMVAYYRANLQPFSDELTSAHPDRAAAITAAVKAHMALGEEGYFLSIPVFIAQADGLLAEISGVESPMTKAAQVFREKYADDPEVLDLLCPFLELKDSAFMMSAKARQNVTHSTGKSFDALNRHQVLHGERSDYGTEINSLKAFSFLVFAGLHIPTILPS